MRPARRRSVCLTQPHTRTYELSESHDLWPFILLKLRLEFEILQAPMGKQVFWFFSNQEAKLFIIVRQPLTPLPEEKPVLNHFQSQTFFIVCFFSEQVCY